MIRRPPRSTQSRSSAASDVYKRQENAFVSYVRKHWQEFFPRMLTPEQMDDLRSVDSPTIANAIEAFDVRDRTVGYPSADVRCLFPDLPITLGYAVTAIADSTVPG